MSKRESILGAALLFAVVAGATLFMQLRKAQQQADAAPVTQTRTGSAAVTPAATAPQDTGAIAAQNPAPPPGQVVPTSLPQAPTPDAAAMRAGAPVPAPLLGRPAVARTVRVAESPAIITSNDQDGDGIVTREEARIADAALHRMWDMYDVNRDGRVEAGEIDQLNAQAAEARSAPGGLAASIMANNDLDRDGVITREEARVAGKALNSTWNQFDRNRDGKVVPSEIGPGR